MSKQMKENEKWDEAGKGLLSRSHLLPSRFYNRGQKCLGIYFEGIFSVGSAKRLLGWGVVEGLKQGWRSRRWHERSCLVREQKCSPFRWQHPESCGQATYPQMPGLMQLRATWRATWQFDVSSGGKFICMGIKSDQTREKKIVIVFEAVK